MDKRPALGKGPSALIPDAPEAPRSTPIEARHRTADAQSLSATRHLDDQRLEDLAQSIAERRDSADRRASRATSAHIIAGERRWRTAQKAGLTRVPVVVRDVKPGAERSILEMALIENIQRENLNPIDEALAYRRLSDEFALTQERIAASVGRTARPRQLPPAAEAPEEMRMSPRAPVDGTRTRCSPWPQTPNSVASPATLSIGACRSARPVDGFEGVRPKTPAEQQTEPPPVDVHTRAAEERLRLLFGTRVASFDRVPKGALRLISGRKTSSFDCSIS